MKKELIQLVMDIIEKYPQTNNKKLNYVFAGSIGIDLLSILKNQEIICYSIKNGCLRELNRQRINFFQDFIRPISDIDIEVYNNSIFPNINYEHKIEDKSFKIENYKKCFKENAEKVIFDYFNSSSEFVFGIKIEEKEIIIEDFRLNLGYRFKTLIYLDEKRFEEGNEKYEETIYKYSRDINRMYKAYKKLLGNKVNAYIEKGLMASIKQEDVQTPDKLKLNILINRLKQLNLNKSILKKLLLTIEDLKLKYYKGFFEDVGGQVEETDKDFHDAIKREMREEMGTEVVIENLKIMGITHFKKREINWIFIIFTGLHKSGKIKVMEKDKCLGYQFFTKEEALCSNIVTEECKFLIKKIQE